MKVIAITGGIACGKSFCTQVFKNNGIATLNADAISHNLTNNEGEALQAISQTFGEEYILNGSLNREAMGKLVFSDNTALKKLNAILHPLINKAINAELNALANKGNKLVAIEIPLLFEANMTNIANYIICCYTTRQIQIDRLIQRNNLSLEDAENRINSQMDLQQKIKLSNFAVDTSHSFENTQTQVENIINIIKQKEGI